VDVRHAAARHLRRALVHDGSPERRASGPDDLCHGAAKVVDANAIHALQIPEQPGSGGSRVGRRDADDPVPGHDEHDREIREPWNGVSHDLLDGLSSGTRSGRDRRSSPSNPLVHDHLGPLAWMSSWYMQATCASATQGTLPRMSTTTEPEAWMRGPIEGIDPMLMPVAHALIQAREELEALVSTVPAEHVWQRPGGAASIGFHVRHLGAALDRLFTYARGDTLSDAQKAALRAEGEPGDPPARLRDLVSGSQAHIDRALEQLRQTRRDQLLDFRGVGRALLPSNVLGLLFHAAEHSTRHAGQLITTAKILAR